uniref:Uncharacterized protein n=1 Tax=Anopheles albimanus TaxID=7167 RepID=A0A182F4B2_ANOAL
MPTSIMQKNYSHCPLKKRPVFLMKDAELALKNDSESEMEPENLSTKPQDLSMKSKKKARSVSPGSPVSVVVIKTEDSLPTPPPSSSPSPSEATKSPISIPTPTYGTLPSIYYPTARSPLSPASSTNGTVAAAAATASSMQDVLYKSFSSVYPAAVAGYPGFPYTMPYPADFYSAAAYHHHHSRQQSFHQQQHQTQDQPQQALASQISPPRSEPLSPYSAGQRDRSPSPSPTRHLFRPERRSLSPPPSMVVPSYPAELRLTQNNNFIKSEPFARSQHRYMPYTLGPHHPQQHPHAQHHHHHAQHPHLMMAPSHHSIEHPSLSPTSSHASFNSYLSSSRGRSLSPASASPGSHSLSEENNNSLTATNGNNVLTEKSTSSSNIQEHKAAADKSSTPGEKGGAGSTGGSAPRPGSIDGGRCHSPDPSCQDESKFMPTVLPHATNSGTNSANIAVY